MYMTRIMAETELLYENRSDRELSDSHSMLEILKKGKSSFLLHQNISHNEEGIAVICSLIYMYFLLLRS